MTKRNEDYSTANNSNRNVTPDCESVNPCEKQYDFSKFNEYFTDVVHPCEFIEELQEIRKSYLEMSLYVLMDFDGMKPPKILPHEDAQNHVFYLSELINLAKTLQQ
jgi:hypothetical protein